ncbi:hypothetical protein [Streptomyces sp. LN245]|uniref:hypothetical protein n=1 Tax=Streptomyces sp. LN245 TaxID=3112975 RepID=UPI0037235C2C
MAHRSGRSPLQPLVRLKGARTPARWAPLPGGTYPTRISGVRLRIIDARIAVTCCLTENQSGWWVDVTGRCS